MVKFIVDSTFCLDEEFVRANEIEVVNLKLILDGVESDEGFKDKWDEFYDRLKESTNFPTTSQPNPADFMKAIDRALEKTPDASIILMTIASGLSGTVNSARLAAENYVGKKITVIDSGNASLCCGMMLEEMLAAAKEGKNHDELVAFAEDLKDRLGAQFIPDTMKYLKRGGRIGTLSALIGSIISIKPIFDFRKNITSVPAKVLGLSKAVSAMIKRLPQKIKRLQIGYINDSKNVPLIQKMLEDRLGLKDVPVFAVNPVFGVHVGIGAIALACLEG